MDSLLYSVFVLFLSVKNNCQRVVDKDRVKEIILNSVLICSCVFSLLSKGTQHLCHHPYPPSAINTLLFFLADHCSPILHCSGKETHLVLGLAIFVNRS